MSDLAGLLKELEKVAKDTNIKEVKNKSLEESVASKDNVSSLFEGLEAAYTETRIEEEIANRLSEEDEQKLGAFSGFMESVTELTNQSNSQKAIEELFATVAPPQPPVEVSVESVDESVDEEIVEEPIEAKEADTIIQQIVSSLDDMGEKTEVKEQVDQISKLRNEFNNFRALMQQQVLSHIPGSGEVRLEFLDDVQRSTAKVNGKFLKYSSSDGKWIGADASGGGGSSAADDISAGDAAVTITTTSGDITIDAAANNSDIILKGTDGGVDTTFLTIDGSAAGKSTFNNEIVSGAVITSGAGIVIADAGNIGSVSDTDAIAIASDGVVTMNQIPVFSAGINVPGGTIAGTLATVAQGNITSLGTLTALTVDDVAVNGKVITMTGSSSDTAVFTAGTNGTLSIVTTDDAAAAANIQITADGTVDIDSAGILTLDSGAAINIEPAAGSAILLDGTISIDAGVVTGATSVTSTAFVGALTGNVTGNASGTAATVTTAAQSNITSLGTLTTLTVDDITINGTTIYATDLILGEDAQTAIDFGTANEIDFKVDNAARLTLTSGALYPVTDNQIDLGTSLLEFKDAFFDGTVTADAFAGPLTGNADTATTLATARTIGGTSFDGTANIAVALATLATTVTITDNESTNENNALIFTAGGDVDGGNLGLESDGTLTYNPSTGKITATGFVGALTGDVTGNTSGTAATVTTAAQTNITSVGTLTALTVDNVVINGATIGHTDDTDLITLSDGAVTIAGNLTVSGTTTTVNQTVVNVTDAFVFEGANADAHETTFRVNEPTADRKTSLQDKTGTIALLSGFKLNATDGSASNDGDFIVLNTSADENDRLLFEDGTSDPLSVLASHGITLVGQGWNAFRFDNSI